MKEISYNQLLDTIHVLNDIVRHKENKVLFATQNKAQDLLRDCVDELELRLNNPLDLKQDSNVVTVGDFVNHFTDLQDEDRKIILKILTSCGGK